MSVTVDDTEVFASTKPCVEDESSERARQREIAAYLSAASFPLELPVCFQEKPILNKDPILNALTQLGAHRLHVDRAFISLIDRKYQYVCTEMTRSHSLVDMESDQGDTVAIGVCKIRNCDGVCPATIKAFMDETGEWVRTGPDVVANRTRYIINNFKTHPDYKDRPYVTAYPFFTSYLEVPLISPLGYVLGSYCVVDSKPNNFDNDEIVKVMNEIASAIMSHLENMRSNQSRGRSEQLVQALSSFIRPEPPVQVPNPPSAGTPGDSMEGSGDPISSTAGRGRELRGSIASSKLDRNDDSSDALSSHGSKGRHLPSARSRSSDPYSSDALSSHNSKGRHLPSARSRSLDPPQGCSETPPTTPSDEPAENPTEQQFISTNIQADANPASPRPAGTFSDSSEPRGFISSANIRATFFRAAATIRRSMDLDGLMFLDAMPSSYMRSDNSSPHPGGTSDEVDGPFCAAIVKAASAPGGETIVQSTQVRLPEASLQRFIQAYPQGHVFTADELGPIPESYGVGKPFQSKPAADLESLDLRNDVTALFRVLPAAKYVIFLPFFHFQRSCWYTCAIGWIEDPARAVGVADIGLVSAFGNSVMAEISRLEAVAASRAKSDFVSSLSHELRSPLHGIMASSELIREAISDRSILSLLDLLDSCSQTALDTFENLLDHAIVAHAGHGSAFNSSHMRQVDLGSMVEDVVEAVRAGHLSGNVFHSQTSSGRKRGAYLTGPTDAAHDLPDRPLLITVQVAKYPWRLTVNVGAWKRIVMNLFGNALKYTNTGRIDVGLNVVKRTDRMGHPQPYISFTVGDTGSGMSADYLKYHLFTPFLQEDSHAPGVGLGLSIVRKLVSDLGGVVNVKSSLGIGTLVEVLVPLGEAVSDSLPADEQQSLHDQFSGLDGRTVCLVGPDAFAALADTDFEITKEVRSWSEIVENALRAIAGSGMEVILGTKDCPAPKADLYVLDSSLFGSTVEERRDIILQKCRERASPLVLLCSGSKTSSCVGHGIKSHDIHLHHPIGPRKLASVFRSALEAKPVGGMVQTRTDEKRYPDDSAKDQSSSPPRTITPKGPALLAPQPPPPESSSKNMKSVTEIPASTGAQSEVPSTKSRHLLLVDDNLINISLLTRLVRKLNHTFETASNGLEAVQRYKSSLEGQSKRFDIIFMDISMPVMNGFEATREIRQLETKAGLSRCRVIALTGLSSEVNRSEANASGVDAFYTKPVRMDTIKGLLDEDRPEASPG